MAEPKKIDPSKIKKILVSICKYHGDILLSTPLYFQIKEAFPDAILDVHTFEAARSILEGHKAIDNLITFDQAKARKSLINKFCHELSTYRKIRKGRYDLAISLAPGDRGSLAVKVSKAKVRVGFDPEGTGMKNKEKFFTHLVTNGKTKRHIIQRYFDSLRHLGVEVDCSKFGLYYDVPKNATLSVHDKLLKGGIDPSNFVLVHPVSRGPFKHWPVDKYKEVVRALLKRGKQVVVTTGPAPNELAYAQEMLSGISDLGLLNLAGKISLKELGALVRDTQMIVCVDSFPLHLSSVFKTPVVVMFGPSCDQTWGPWQNPDSRIVSVDWACRACLDEGCGNSWQSACLDRLEVSKVLKEVDELFAREQIPPPSRTLLHADL